MKDPVIFIPSEMGWGKKKRQAKEDTLGMTQRMQLVLHCGQ